MTHRSCTLAVLLLVVILAGCGGGDLADDDTMAGLQVTGHGLYPDCPADPASFVGPLLPQCLDPAARRSSLPVHCADAAPCSR